jgi:hypothetical protein
MTCEWDGTCCCLSAVVLLMQYACLWRASISSLVADVCAVHEAVA